MIKETEWKSGINVLVDFKHVWACKNGKCYVSVATRPNEIGYAAVQITPNQEREYDFAENVPVCTVEKARARVQEWLDNK